MDVGARSFRVPALGLTSWARLTFDGRPATVSGHKYGMLAAGSAISHLVFANVRSFM